MGVFQVKVKVPVIFSLMGVFVGELFIYCQLFAAGVELFLLILFCRTFLEYVIKE